MKTAPSTRLVSGPAMAILNSTLGLVGSPLIWATPPKMNRVMDSTGMPDARATTLCIISWASTEAKNSKLVTTLTIIEVARLHSG